MLRSILSILAGVITWGVLWVAANATLAAAMTERFNDDGTTRDSLALTIIIAISIVLSVLVGWLCATIAKRRMMTHVLVLALIQLGIGIAVQSTVWDLMPIWYHLTFLGLVIPGHLLGGRLRTGSAAAHHRPSMA